MTVEVTVWYDGDCPLCRNEIAVLRALGGKVAFVDLSIGEPCPIDRAAMKLRFHAQAPGGPLLSGAEAFAAMWRAVPPLPPSVASTGGPSANPVRWKRSVVRVEPAVRRSTVVAPRVSRELTPSRFGWVMRYFWMEQDYLEQGLLHQPAYFLPLQLRSHPRH